MAKPKSNETDYFLCPHCGGELPVGAAVCRECGASDESGWHEGNWESDATGYGDEDDFDYDEFIRSEFPEQATGNKRSDRKRVFMTVVVIVLCLSLLLWMLM